MATYSIANNNVFFSDAREKFCEFFIESRNQRSQSVLYFSDWYIAAKKAETVASDCYYRALQFGGELLDKWYTILPSLEIYDIGRTSYQEQLSNYGKVFSPLLETLENFKRQLDNIDITQNSSSTIIISAISASSDRNSLYEKYRNIMIDEFSDALDEMFVNFTKLVQKYNPNAFEVVYQYERSEALIKSAETISEKAPELLAQAFDAYPFNQHIYKFLFSHYPEDRKNILNIAKHFKVDTNELVESTLSNEAPGYCLQTETSALETKKKIEKLMDEYGVTNSETLNKINTVLNEFDIQARTFKSKRFKEQFSNLTEDEKKFFSEMKAIGEAESDTILFDSREEKNQAVIDDERLYNLCMDKNNMSRSQLLKIKTTIENDSACEKIRSIYLSDINQTISNQERTLLESFCMELETSDEENCNLIKNKISSADASDSNKAIFIKRVDDRIYQIWVQEDYEHFSDLFLKTQATPEDVSQTIRTIRETAKTDCNEAFITALELLKDMVNVKIAAQYIINKEKGGFAAIKNLGKSNIYNNLTMQGTLIHPAIQIVIDEINQAPKSKIGLGNIKDKGLFNILGGGNKTKDCFCVKCGSKISNGSKFCPNCGAKQE